MVVYNLVSPRISQYTIRFIRLILYLWTVRQIRLSFVTGQQNGKCGAFSSIQCWHDCTSKVSQQANESEGKRRRIGRHIYRSVADDAFAFAICHLSLAAGFERQITFLQIRRAVGWARALHSFCNVASRESLKEWLLTLLLSWARAHAPARPAAVCRHSVARCQV